MFFFVLFCFLVGGGGGGMGRGSISCSYQCFQELCLETRHGEVHFSQHFLFKIERYVQSQSKLLGHLTVFLPSQCWCANLVSSLRSTTLGGQGDGPEVKTALGGGVPTIFV